MNRGRISVKRTQILYPWDYAHHLCFALICCGFSPVSSINILQQSGRSPKVVALFLLQTLVSIKCDYFNCMIQSKRSQILVPNLVAFISQNEKNVWFFDYHLLTCCVRKKVLICLMQNIDMCLLYKYHQIARLVSHLINHFSKWMFTVYHKMLLNSVAKMKFYTSSYIIKWLLMATL